MRTGVFHGTLFSCQGTVHINWSDRAPGASPVNGGYPRLSEDGPVKLQARDPVVKPPFPAAADAVDAGANRRSRRPIPPAQSVTGPTRRRAKCRRPSWS